MRDATVGSLLVLAAATGFATLPTFGKFAEASGLTRPTLLFFRFTIGAIVVWSALWVRGEATVLEGRELRAGVVLGVIYGGLSLAYFAGLSFLTASLTGILFFTYPMYVFVLSAVFLKENVTLPRLGALGLAFVGVVLVIGIDSLRVHPMGVFFMTLAAIGYSIYTVGGRAMGASTNPRILTAHLLVVTTAVIGLRWAQTGVAFPRTTFHWAIVLGIGTVGTGIPLLCYYEGLKRIEAIRVSILGTAEPVVTVVLGVTILGDTLAPTTIVGGVLVIGGVTIIQTSQRQRAWVLSKIGMA